MGRNSCWSLESAVEGAMSFLKVCLFCFSTEHISTENTTNGRGLKNQFCFQCWWFWPTRSDVNLMLMNCLTYYHPNRQRVWLIQCLSLLYLCICVYETGWDHRPNCWYVCRLRKQEVINISTWSSWVDIRYHIFYCVLSTMPFQQLNYKTACCTMGNHVVLD